MKLKMKSVLIHIFLIWLHSLSISSGKDIYLTEILETTKEDWIETYITALNTLCHRQTIFVCKDRLVQGNVTLEPLFPRDESFCCLTFHCFGSCTLPVTNCSNRIQSFHSSMTRQYLDFTSCVDSYKYLTRNSLHTFDKLSGIFGNIMVSSCPKNASIEEKYICENQTGEELRPLVDTIPVTANDVHFVNRHCASCHGEKSNYVFWDLKIHCSNTSNELQVTKENLNRVIKERDDCHLNRVPPVKSPTLPMCRLNVISTCNETGQWKNYNRKMEELCLDPFLGNPFIGKSYAGRKTYKNVFCALCNDITVIAFEDCIYELEPVELLPDFTHILSFNTEESGEAVEDLDCPLQHIIVPQVNECMRTYCSPPLITDILRNTCLQPSVDKGKSVRIDYAFKVRLDSTMNLSSRFELEEAIADSLSMFNDTPCVITFAYELDGHLDECNDAIDGYFDVVYCYVKALLVTAQHLEVSDIKNRLPPDRAIVINGTTSTIRYSHHEADPNFLAGDEGLFLNQEPQKIHNPYSKASMIVFRTSGCYNMEEPDRTYSIIYMDCPSILLSLQMFNAERNELGLLLKGAETIVPFSDFRSLNSTHVYVCQETLLAMNVASKTGQQSYYNGIMMIVFFFTLQSLLTLQDLR